MISVILTNQARKAQVGALIAFLGPLGTFLVIEQQWDWRAFAGAVISGLIAGLSVFYKGNADAPPLNTPSPEKNYSPPPKEATP
jgi:hypothetical protein